MTVETAEDRATLLADFGETVLFSPGSTYPNRNDNSESITVIFDNGFYDVPLDAAAGTAKNPSVLTRTADTEDAARNSMIERGEDRYKVVEVEPDGNGFSVLSLEGPR